jgi:hypothetical protein
MAPGVIEMSEEMSEQRKSDEQDEQHDESLGVEQLPQSELEAVPGGEKRSLDEAKSANQSHSAKSDRSVNKFVTNDNESDELSL